MYTGHRLVAVQDCEWPICSSAKPISVFLDPSIGTCCCCIIHSLLILLFYLEFGANRYVLISIQIVAIFKIVTASESCPENSIPGQVTLLRAIKVTTSSIQITWDSPLENETCLKKYQICWDSNGTNCETIPDNNSTGFTIDNLVACTTYNISVAALGISGSSENVTFINTTAPNPVRSISQSKKTTQYVILNWKPPDRGNECLESFAIYVCDHTKNIVNEKLIAIIPGSITTFNYTGLEACAGVLVNIKTMDQHKSTSDLGSGQFYLQAGGEDPGTVTNLTTIENLPDKMVLQWEPPKTQSKCAYTYKICWHMRMFVDEETCRNLPFSYNNKQIKISPLKSCTRYDVSIQIFGPNGIGVAFNKKTISQVTPPENVKNIWKFVGALRSERAIYVRWETAHESLDCVQQFEICWSQMERGSAIEGGCDVVSSSTTWFSIPGMVHDKGYRVEMMIIYFGGQTSEKYVLNVPSGTSTPCNISNNAIFISIIMIFLLTHFN